MPRLETAVSLAMFTIFAGMIALAWDYPPQARLVPLVVAIPAAALAAWQLLRDLAARGKDSGEDVARETQSERGLVGIAWLGVLLLLVLAGGFVGGGTLGVMLCQRFWLRESWGTTLIGGAVSILVLFVGFERLLGLLLFEGWIAEWIQR